MTEDRVIDSDWYDRKARSLITALLMENQEEADEIVIELYEMREDPMCFATLLGTYWATTRFLLAHMAADEDVFSLWTYFMREIELESLQDGV